MTIEEIRQELVEQGKDPDDFTILITENGYSVTPKWFYETKQLAKQEDIELGIENTELDLKLIEMGQQNTDLELRLLVLEGK
jgi:hypothetical protein